MPKTRLQKEATVELLKEKFDRSKSVVFADYRGLTMATLSELRKKLREQEAELSVTKNSLIHLAEPKVSLDGPTATLFSYDDEISPIKTLVKTLKDSGLGKVKAGILGDDLLDEYQVISLSNLPTKDELRGKTVGVLVAPLQGMVGVLQANLRNLVYALSEIQKMRGGE